MRQADQVEAVGEERISGEAAASAVHLIPHAHENRGVNPATNLHADASDLAAFLHKLEVAHGVIAVAAVVEAVEQSER